MKISALTDIVEGKLLNTPSISFITQIHTDLKKLNDGDAFFANNQSELDKALDSGIFAVIIDFVPVVTDNEIAWIKVDCIYKAKTNILRYKLLQQEVNFIEVDTIFFQFLNLFKTKDLTKNMLLLSNNLSKDFEKLISITTSKTIFSTDTTLLDAISPNIKKLRKTNFKIDNLTVHSIFEVSFSYKDKYFEKLKLPKIYINYFLKVLEIYNNDIDMKRLINSTLLDAIYINKSNQIVQQGQTNKFILANSDKSIYNSEINFIKEYYSYAKIKIINISTMTNNDIFNLIKLQDYNALYLKGKDIKLISKILEQNNTLDKLF